jgi:hypothetical protein
VLLLAIVHVLSFHQTYIDIFCQKLVRDAVFVNDIVVHAGAGGCRAEEETEKSGLMLGTFSLYAVDRFEALLLLLSQIRGHRRSSLSYMRNSLTLL